MIWTAAAIGYAIRHPWKARRWWKAMHAPWPPVLVQADAIIEAEARRLAKLAHPSNGRRAA